MLPQEIIRRKRNREALSEREIGDFIAGVTSGDVTDAHIAAFAMAVFLNGMNRSESVALTLAMRDSGDVLKWGGLPGPVVDKHSTGGIGDNVSLMLAPMLAACGAFVPMISGRGLGHTGGTLDKLESIPGYTVQPDNETFRACVREVGAAIIGQTRALAPADSRIYAVRDVTATVESIPLITASILSKKLAAGLECLVFDVKSGNGAFMETGRDAAKLARMLVQTANGAGLATSALVTDMNQPLASAAGNAVEVRNAIDFLTGNRRERRLEAVTLALCNELLHLSGLAPSWQEAAARSLDALESGRAAEAFAAMVARLGGPRDLMDKPEKHLPSASVTLPVPAPREGYVEAIASRDVGLTVVALGGGRTRPGDRIDPAVGLTGLLPIGARVDAGDPLALVHARSREAADAAAAAILAAYRLGEARPRDKRPVIRRIA